MDLWRTEQISREENPTDILKPVLHFTALSGQDVYPSGYLTRFQKKVFNIFRIIVSLFLIWNIIRLYLSFYDGMNRENFLICLYFLLVYSLEVIKHGLKLILNRIYSRGLLKKFEACVVSSLRERKYLEKLKREIKIFVGFSTIIIIASIILIISCSIAKFTTSSVKSLLTMLMSTNKIFGSINFGIFSWFIASGILSDDILLYVFSKITCCELHAISQKLKELYDEEQSNSNIKSKLIYIQKKYEEIMELLHQVNIYFSIYTVIIFMFAIIFSCMLIVIVFREDVDSGEIVIAAMNTSMYILLAISVLYSGISVQHAVC